MRGESRGDSQFNEVHHAAVLAYSEHRVDLAPSVKQAVNQGVDMAPFGVERADSHGGCIAGPPGKPEGR